MSVRTFENGWHVQAQSENLTFSSPRTIADYYMEDMRHRTREIFKN